MNKQTSKVLATILAVSILGTSTSVLAASDMQKAQQARFGECSHQAKVKGLKGADFKSFMHTCASSSGDGTKAPVATTSSGGRATSTSGKSISQRDRMKDCNADAKTRGLEGTTRREFMKSCLSS
jgi:hypothetical protein